MTVISIIKEPAILIITFFFLFCTIKVLVSYGIVQKNLESVYNFLKTIEKNELSYRFCQIDEFMHFNEYTNTCWEDLKKSLVFPEKLFSVSQSLQSSVNSTQDIYLTIDSSYFFNEDSLVYSRINYKFIQIMPTLLTGLGPFFTFLKMAMVFTAFHFTTDISATLALTNLMSGIQIAALCSVTAVGFSLLFMLIEKNLYNIKCKKYYLLIQKELIRLFDVCTSEQLLLDLVKETKIQNHNNEKVLKNLTQEFSTALSKTFGEVALPYMENIIYSLNKLNETINKGSKGDVVDKLF